MDTPEVTPRLHNVPTSRKILGGIGHTKFYDEVRSGKIKLVKIGDRSFVTDDELARYVETLKAAAASIVCALATVVSGIAGWVETLTS